ncbi:anoctamin-10 isoform X2 [Anopheles merus]|uniref:Anoctamin n=1 Tax=Anopheles merus TaxID=30066 RepID=A0A182VMB6_ANOME|nr:anoctamin-10 isoform X2 [Anopheles merus]XP_041778402.1 anoctamin-10 isoform X2 [Anopheles merus]XP_041778403.1 anoctamin-10 isoform X2 [Anopheles merus]XP_041778404.1 anoctamin-10 isoform X2 [Anopheles merus]XP_041778405.1 anoctamin-10 isoform X2 [Anopheles merus]XP_041778406.1 anoctamin-10 isoform X2 [Anopheles merus]
MDDIKENLIPNLHFAENDEEELAEEIGLPARPTIPSLLQRNSQINLLEKMDHSGEQNKLNELRNRKGTVRINQPKVTRQDKARPPDDEQEPFGESLMLLEFSENAPVEAIQWIMDKIRGRRVDGGMELMVRKEPLSKDSKTIIFHLSATHMKLLEIADDMGFMKRTKSGIIRNFNVACLDEFFYDESMALEDILTPADRQIIVKHALETIKAADDEHRIPGTKIILYHGQSIIQAAQSAELITNLYSLHDKRTLKELRHRWIKPTRVQPIDEIRDYFGESVGMYFSFLGFYTYALVVPTVFGFLQLGLSEETETVPFFCVFYVVWMKVFLELWKRKSSSHAYRWGTITMTNLDEPRPGYYGKLARDPITGKWTPQYPKWKTYVQMYCVTAPIIMLCMGIAAFVTIFQFYVEAYLAELFGPDAYILYLPSVVNAIYIAVSTLAYDRLATYLTDKENHRTQSQYERHRVNKLIVLEFVNNFLCLFYIAFILQDMKMLKTQLMMQLIVLQFLQNVFENLYPYLKKKVGLKIVRLFVKSNYEKLKLAHESYDEMGLRSLDEDDPRVVQNRKETILEEYNTYDDYLELYIQFGYVVLFSSVAPLTAFWAILNNVIEIRLDAYKLCSFFKRPFARRTKNIGAWQLAFETLAVISILTNCGILYLSPHMRELGAGLTREAYTLTFLIIEHVLLGLTWFIYKAIPDTPHWVRVALAKAEHESRQALKRENAQRSRNVLFRRFRSVYDTHSMLS